MTVCLQAIHDEERVDDIILHDHLREAIVKTMEDPDSPWGEGTTRGTSPTPVAMMVYDTTGMPYSKAKAKAYGKGPRAVIWSPGHPNAPDAQASQATNPVGEATLQLTHCPSGSFWTDFLGMGQESICLRQ